jgi:hypothetical protein
MTYFKITAVLILALLFSSCSLIDNLKEKLSGKSEEDKEEVTKEETAGTTSQNDLQFYNKYIEVENKVSETVEQFHKAYLSEVPEPKTIDKNSMIFIISTEVYAGNMERIHKDYKRSLFDNGELAKLQADNTTMKNEVEENFKTVLDAIEQYYTFAKEVIEYYKNKDYEQNAPLAVSYDDRMKDEYNKFKDAFDKLNETLKKYKPIKTMQDPDKISDPNLKAVAVLMNTYENTLDGAEAFYGMFQKVDINTDVTDLSKALDEFEKKFNEDKGKVESTEFTEQTKYMKYNFEDYFSKTVKSFVEKTRRFINDKKTKKMNSEEFNRGYDNVITYYNNMINAYNSSIGVLNSYQSY